MTKTTDNLPPIGRDTSFVTANGKLTAEAHNWLTASRDQSLGKNRVSDAQTLGALEQVSPLSENVRVQSTGGSVTLNSNPQILSGYDGQLLRLEGLSDTDSVKIKNGNGVFLPGGVDIELKNNIMIVLHYNAQKVLWIEN